MLQSLTSNAALRNLMTIIVKKEIKWRRKRLTSATSVGFVSAFFCLSSALAFADAKLPAVPNQDVTSAFDSLSAAIPEAQISEPTPEPNSRKGLVVLIPGTGNSAVPGQTPNNKRISKLNGTYYGKIPVTEFEKQGYRVFIPTGLLPVGDVTENGERVFRKLKAFYERNYPLGDMPIYMLGHSAGGLYGMKVLELNQAMLTQTMPIKKLVLLSTPLEGSPFAEILFGRCVAFFGCNTIQRTIHFLASELGLDGVIQMRDADVKEFIDGLVLPSNVEIATVGGTQYSNLRARAARFCPLCISANLLFDTRSDGVIGINSAYGTSTRMVDGYGEEIKLRPLYDYHVPLGHHEQVLSLSILRYIGHRNLRYVRKHQRRFYGNMGRYFADSDAIVKD